MLSSLPVVQLLCMVTRFPHEHQCMLSITEDMQYLSAMQVNHAEPVPAYGQQQQMMVPMTPQPHYPQQWRM